MTMEGISRDRRRNSRASKRVAKKTKESITDDEEVENKDKEVSKNSTNKTEIVTKLLNK